MRTRRGLMVIVPVVLAWFAVQAGAQTAPTPSTPEKPATKSAAKATASARPKALTAEALMPMTCAQAWAAAGKQYPAMYDIVATLATVSLANRDLTFPNTKEAGMDAGKGIAEDCETDPQGLLFGIVDKHVRRVARAAGK